MFKEAELTYFRQHEKLTVNFENGVVALKGGNERGKSTLLEALAYAWFGTSALRESLDKVVTYDHKESELKVRTVTQINGAVYHTKRSKSGAEVSDGVRILATGQTEVKKFWESLLGANAETCRNLMLADQTALRGVLSKGPGAAIELIETLANFSLIETLIGLVQTKLACGATTTVEARIALLDQQLNPPPTHPVVEGLLGKPDPLGLDAAQTEVSTLHALVDSADIDVQSAIDRQASVRINYDAIQTRANLAQQTINTHKLAGEALTAAGVRRDTAIMNLDAIKPVPGPTEAAITELRKLVADESRIGRASVAKTALDKLTEPDNEWEGDLDSLLAEIAVYDKAVKDATAGISDVDKTASGFKAQRVTESACGLCGKDLQNVPEVVAKNAKIDTELKTLATRRKKFETAYTEAIATYADLQAINVAQTGRQRVYQAHGEFITLDHGFVPSRWTWTGPDIEGKHIGGAANRLGNAESQAAKYQQDLGRQQQAQRAVDEAVAAHTLARTNLEAAEKPLAAAKATLEDAAKITAAMFEADARVKTAQETAQTQRQALSQAQAVLRERLNAREALQAQLAASIKELENIRFNNALVKALRDARPDIANELWGIMSGSISQYFSEIRGTPSTFTRDADGFKINGRSVPGLSGSTLDALGLAVRMAATKTFLPNTSFMVLDEPAAAADEGRETNMLGVIAASEFDQVIVVSHSALLESFAAQVIQL